MSHVICVFSVFWALYLTHNLYIGLHIQTVILKYWALNVDHYSSLSPIIWAIYADHFYYRILWQKKHAAQYIGLHICSILFKYSKSFGLYIQSTFLDFFFLFLIIGYICRPYCVLWFGSLGYICDPLPHFHGPRVLRRKISVAYWGYGDWQRQRRIVHISAKEYILGLCSQWMRWQAERG